MAGRPRRTRSRPAEPDDPQRDLGPPADPESVARTILLTKLTAQARSRQELAQALAAKDVPDDVAERTLDRFEEVGLIDDAAFAETWVRSRHASRGLSRRALSHELRHKGVDADVIRDSVEAIDLDAEVASARALVDRKIASTRRLDRQTRFRRLIGLLARKGYSGSLAVLVVKEALAADQTSEASLDDEITTTGVPELDELGAEPDLE